METDYASLHNISDYSILNSLASPSDFFNQAKKLGIKALAITDNGTLSSVFDSYKAAKSAGIQYIVGCNCYFINENDPSSLRRIVLLAKNAKGYENLLQMNIRGYDFPFRTSKKSFPVINWELFEKYSSGLICLTGCGNGIISQLLMQKNNAKAEEELNRLKSLFNEDLYVEVQANNMKRFSVGFNGEIDQQFINRQLINLANKLEVKIVPTSNSLYLTKEDSEIHDVELCIASGQPKHSNYRLKYGVSDFYLKPKEDIHSFFSRNYGEEFSETIIKNTVEVASKCESPEWIFPKTSNPSGKELPDFDCKSEKDYGEFLAWKNKLSEDRTNLKEDNLFIRFRVEKEFVKKFNNLSKEKIQEYWKRIEDELDVFEYRGISSYMLIVADFLNWCRNNNVSVGFGRGCLVGETKVLTESGYKQLKNICVNDKVYTHTGELKSVKNTFEYDLNEEDLLELKIEQADNFNLKLTKDHMVYACKRIQKIVEATSNTTNSTYKYKKYFFQDPAWIQAKDLEVGDYIFNPKPIRNFVDYNLIFDLNDFNVNKNDFDENKIYINQIIISDLSIRKISREIGEHYSHVRNIKNNNLFNSKILEKVTNYISTKGLSLSDWQNEPKFNTYGIKRFIKLDDDILYLIGRFAGDGHIRKNNNGFSIAFNANDASGISKIENILSNIGIRMTKGTIDNALCLESSSRIFSRFLRSIFCNYKNNSETKHSPLFLSKLSESQLKSLALGLIDSDGSLNKKSGMESFSSTSENLAYSLKEMLTYFGIQNNISKFESKRYSIKTKDRYVLTFRGIKGNNSDRNKYKNGYYSRITEINNLSGVKKVYDIMVDDNHSYLTSCGAVHNSAGGSLVAHILGIHEADSIKYGLIFERFFNRLKENYADVDSDVSKKDRSRVINYLSNKYGSDRTSQISNIIWQSPKVYVKDICRTFELGGSKEAAVDLGNIISGCISNDASSIKAAKEASPLLCAHIEDFPEIEKCSIIEQKPRAFGTHAAGVIIGKRSLEKIVPLRKDVDGSVVLEVDKDYAEDIGLVKMDVLGLSTLDIIDNTYRLIQKAGKKVPVIDKEKYDKKTYDLISSGNTFGVFQFGTSAGTIDLCKKIKPKSIEDLAIITTIARPSSKDIREDFILRKMGKREITYPHPKLENALKNSFGHCIYDESLLILANDVAGWDLNEADKLRKLTKEKGKNPEKVKKWRQEFIDNSVANNVTEEDAIFIWDSVIQNFAKYSFNKSHAVLYSFVSYITAYLKAHYPVEFLLANLMQEIESNTQDSSDNILRIKSELRNYGLTIKQPDINLSEKDYNIIGDNLITGLSGIKFLGEDAIEDILKKRPFTSLIDFFDRVDSSKVRANSIQALVACGAFDCFNETRKNMFQYCSDIRKNLTTYKRKNLESAIGKTDFNIEFPNKEEEWALRDLYALEMKYIGEAFICKPAKAYKSFFNKEFCKISDILKMKDKSSISSFKFILKDFVELKVKKETSKYYGQSMIKANVEDSNQDNISLTIFPDKYRELLAKLNKKNISALEAGQAFHISCNINTYENEVGLIYNDIYELELPPDVPSDSKTKKVFRKTKKTIKEEIIDELHKDNVILEIKD